MSTNEHSVKTCRLQEFSYNACLDRQVRSKRTLSSTPGVKQRYLKSNSASATQDEDTENSVDVHLSFFPRNAKIIFTAFSGKCRFDYADLQMEKFSKQVYDRIGCGRAFVVVVRSLT